jgi:elongation factor G
MSLSRIRNLGLMAHMDAGKTTATERMLALANVVNAVDVQPVSEADDLLTITSAATTCTWREHALNIIDTPGQVDFTLDVERALRVLDGAVALFSGVSGVENQTETFWRQADQYDVPRLAFINKLDREGADFDRVVEAITLRLDTTVLPLQVPLYGSGDLVGLIDLVDMNVVTFDGETSTVKPISDELLPLARARREVLLDTLVEFDDALGDLVVASGDIPVDVLKRSIRKATVSFGVVPVLGGSAFRGRGIAQLLDAVVDFLPSPLDVPPAVGYLPGSADESVTRLADVEAPLAALSFRVVTDRQNGPLNFVRVYSGVLEVGASVRNPKSGRDEIVSGLTKIHATRRVALDRAMAGDIVAVSGLTATVVGDTLCSAEAPVVLDSLDVPPAVVTSRVTVDGDDADRLEQALEALAKQDPTLRAVAMPQAGVVDLEGVSETHLDIVLARLRREFDLDLRAEQPRVAYRETVLRAVEVKVRENGAALAISIEPGERGDGCRVESRLSGDERGTFQQFERALREAIELGGLRGYPLIDVVAGVSEALLPANASREALERLAARALEQALREAGTTVLEPVMRVEVVSPDDLLGEVLGELTSMRGHVKRIESRGSIRALTAYVPLSEVGGYPDRLRRLSGGQANFSMQFAYYERRPAEFADTLEAMNQ